MKQWNFDGKGINGGDEYMSRIATLTDHGHSLNAGALMSSAPELLAALQLLCNMQVKGHALIDRLQFSEEGRAISNAVLSAIDKATKG